MALKAVKMVNFMLHIFTKIKVLIFEFLELLYFSGGGTGLGAEGQGTPMLGGWAGEGLTLTSSSGCRPKTAMVADTS